MYKSSSHHLVDSRKEKEMKVDEALDELRRKGFSWERVNEYYKRQSEWWKECDRVNKITKNRT
jgi:hypothetical protein